MSAPWGPGDGSVADQGWCTTANALADRPVLIVLDLVMPEMDGLHVCKTLRSQEATRRTPIVMLTSQVEWASMKAGYLHGCTSYLTKPIDGPRLLAKVKVCLSKAGDQR